MIMKDNLTAQQRLNSIKESFMVTVFRKVSTFLTNRFSVERERQAI